MFSKSFIKKTGIYFLGNLSSKIMSALLIPIYAFYINSNDLGYFDFSQTLMGIATPIIILAIWEAILKFTLSEDKVDNKQKIITTAVLFCLAMSVFFIVGTLLFEIIFSYQMKYFGLIMTMIILHSLVFVWQYYVRALGKNKLFIISGIYSTIINFLLIILLIVIMKKGLLGLLVSYNISQLFIIIIIERKVKIFKNISLKDFQLDLLREMLSFSSPLVLNLISAWLISGFSRFIITLKLGVEGNGLFSFANRFSLLITMVGSVITMAIIEEAILSLKKNNLNKNFGSTIEGLFKVFQLLIILAIPAVTIFYSFLHQTDYYTSLVFVPYLLMYAVMNTMASNIGSLFQAINKTQYQFFTTLLGGVTTVVISLVFIEKYGINAVVVGQLLGALLMVISRYLLINQFIEFKIKWLPIFLRMLVFIMITVLCFQTNVYLSILWELLILFVIFYLEKDLVKKSIIKIKKIILKR